METRITGYLIERIPQQTPALYLGAAVSNSDSPADCTGYFAWMPDHINALRFVRRIDAVCFIGVLRMMSDSLPHGSTLIGLRSGDPAPVVSEHVWIGANGVN